MTVIRFRKLPVEGGPDDSAAWILDNRFLVTVSVHGGNYWWAACHEDADVDEDIDHRGLCGTFGEAELAGKRMAVRLLAESLRSSEGARERDLVVPPVRRRRSRQK